MESKRFKELCEMSALNYDDLLTTNLGVEIDTIIKLADTIKGFPEKFNQKADNNAINFSDLREDICPEPFPIDKLMQNTEPSDNYYVVPKLME